MFIRNETDWPVRVEVVDLDSGAVMAAIGVMPRKRVNEFIIARTSDEPTDEFVAEGTITIVTKTDTTDPKAGTYAADPKTPAHHPLIDGTVLRVTPLEFPRAGEEFALETPDPPNLDEVRRQFKEVFERGVHIRAKIGPIRFKDENGLSIPIEAVDDPVLLGVYNRFPQREGCSLLVGYYL